MSYIIRPDGSFDIALGSIYLKNAYPAIDGIPLRAVSCAVNAGTAEYTLLNGKLTLTISEDAAGISISCAVSGLNAHDIAPISGAVVAGADSAFHQGFGIGGPSGFISPDSAFNSDGLIALGNSADCLTVHATDHRKYRIHYHMENSRLCAMIDTEMTITGDTELPTLFIRSCESFDAGLRACSAEIAAAMNARTPKSPAFHWCSWYYLYHNLDQPLMEDYLVGFNKHRDVAPFRHIQIDAGYFPSCGDWLEPNPRFPEGMKKAAETIIAAGYEPGVWIAPYMVGDESKVAREHPDWLLHNLDGSLFVMSKQYNEPKMWGYRDNEYNILDVSNPEALAYISNVFATMRSWGYTLYKTDFLLWGMHDSTKFRRHTPGKTSFEYFRDLMSAIRTAIGEESAWLGCIAPFMPSIGYVDMMRIGGDVGAQWEKNGFGPVNMIQEIHADQYFSNVYWQNDPDAVLLRDFHIHLKPHQIEALAILQAISGGVITTSDPVHLIAPDRRALLELICPRGVVKSAYPYWQEDRAEEIITADTTGGKLAYFFNPTSRDLTIPTDWAHILGDTDWQLLKLHGDSKPAHDIPCITVPAQSGVLFFASREKLAAEPRNMWEW
ncbi:MAG: alpha-galactosidase [Clostridia bacterium]|nr:alpha-galactosidase [Clostridia bacterium]